MKLYLYAFTILFSIGAVAQNPFSEADARKVVDTFFEGFHEGDTTKMRSVIHSNIEMQTAFTGSDGNHQIVGSDMDDLLKAISERQETQTWDERLLSYTVQIDGNLAHVWTPYEFWFNGAFSHCGANAFTLARSNDGWKIVHLIDSRRNKGCGE